MDQVVKPGLHRLDNKNFPGAIDIITFFANNQHSYAKIARLFDPENATTMIAVFRSDKWSKDDIDRWRKVIKAHREMQKRTKERTAKSNTVVIKKVKEKKLR